jgi:hypothetical protein
MPPIRLHDGRSLGPGLACTLSRQCPLPAITQITAGAAAASPQEARWCVFPSRPALCGLDPSPHGRCTLRRGTPWEFSSDQSARPLKALLHLLEHPLRRFNEFID